MHFLEFLKAKGKAKEFPKGFEWLNTTKALTLEQLRGHVVVLDFWTYCCINCIHTIPTLARVEKKYAGKPVVVIGVHSAKFEQEANPKNIQSAIGRYDIKHPVIVDQGHAIWNSYLIRAWPTIIIIDPEGNIAYNAAGEGNYESLTSTIDELLEKHAHKGTLAAKKTTITQPKAKKSNTLSFPGKLCFSPDKKFLVLSDSGHNQIVISDLNGKITARIGNGKKGFTDGAFAKASFNKPQGVFWGAKWILVCDTENHALRLVDLKSKTVKTVAGTGKQLTGKPAGGTATKTALSSPWDVSELEGKVIVAMAGTHQLWEFEPGKNYVKPLAGTGGEGIVDGPANQALLAQPSGLAAGKNTTYFADSEVSGIRKLDLAKGEVSTISGIGLFRFGLRDGPASEALFQHPLGLCYSVEEHSLYVADTYNNAIRRVDLARDEVATLVGMQKHSKVCMIGDKACDLLPLNEPSDVKILGGKLYITDTNNHLIRVFDLKTKELKDLEVK